MSNDNDNTSHIPQSLINEAGREAKISANLTVLMDYLLENEAESFFDLLAEEETGPADYQQHPYYLAAECSHWLRLLTRSYIMRDPGDGSWQHVQPEQGPEGVELSTASGYPTAAEAWEDNEA